MRIAALVLAGCLTLEVGAAPKGPEPLPDDVVKAWARGRASPAWMPRCVIDR